MPRTAGTYKMKLDTGARFSTQFVDEQLGLSQQPHTGATLPEGRPSVRDIE